MKPKLYKIARKKFYFENRFEQYEKLQKFLDDNGYNINLLKALLNKEDKKTFVDVGIETALFIFNKDHFRELLSILLRRWHWFYGLGSFGTWLNELLYPLSKFENNKKLFMRATIEEAQQPLNDFFLSIIKAVLESKGFLNV